MGWSANILSTMTGDELEIPPAEFCGIHRKRYTISPLDAKNFPFAPVCWSQLTFQRMCALSSLLGSRCTELPCSPRPCCLNRGPPCHWPLCAIVTLYVVFKYHNQILRQNNVANVKVYFSIVLLISDPDKGRKLLLKVRDRVSGNGQGYSRWIDASFKYHQRHLIVYFT